MNVPSDDQATTQPRFRFLPSVKEPTELSRPLFGWNEQEIFGFALLRTKPFQTIRADKLATCREIIDPPDDYSCSDRLALVRRLANELWVYNHLCTIQEQQPQETHARIKTAFENFGELSVMRWGPHRRPRPHASLKKAYKAVWEDLRVWMSDENPRRWTILEYTGHALQVVLVERMFSAVKQYGTDHDDMNDHIVAAILVDLGVEQGHVLGTIVKKYRQRRSAPRQARKSHSSALAAAEDRYVHATTIIASMNLSFNITLGPDTSAEALSQGS
jgi:hypothetical protein